jgi:hypothetical protein
MSKTHWSKAATAFFRSMTTIWTSFSGIEPYFKMNAEGLFVVKRAASMRLNVDEPVKLNDLYQEN